MSSIFFPVTITANSHVVIMTEDTVGDKSVLHSLHIVVYPADGLRLST